MFFVVGAGIIFANSCAVPGDVDEIEIDPAHQVCASDEDCALVITHCSTCDCGTAINGSYEELYNDLLFQACRNYSGGVCEMDCPPSELACISGTCSILIGATPSETSE